MFEMDAAESMEAVHVAIRQLLDNGWTLVGQSLSWLCLADACVNDHDNASPMADSCWT